MENINQIKTTIQETYDEYKYNESVKPSLLWEIIKLKVREKLLRYSKNKKKQAKKSEIYVKQTIARLQEELVNKTTGDTLFSHLEEQFNDSKLELEKITEFHTKGAVLRSKTRTEAIMKVKKNTKYFLNLEKRHFKQGTISQTKNEIIKLIPKKDAEPFFIKNWRPRTPLNCDCKIATKSIANCLKPSLPILINYDQMGFIKGRFIGENICLIDSVICYAKEENFLGSLLFLDFEKAFDTIELSFIRKTFQHFGFSSSMFTWLNLFYCRPESCVLNNGWASNFFEIQRGVR